MQISGLFSILAVAGVAAALPQGTPTLPSGTTNTTASATATATCSPGPAIEYTVVSGDTLTKISQKFSSGICDISYANGLANPNFLSLGQVLKVPTQVCNPDNTSCLAKDGDATCVKDGPTKHTIVSGDTFFLVAQRYGLDVNALLNANQGVDPLLLQPGDSINIPVC
ncbi:intracellular hyphae protein 1 [Colletotrichum spaethianum]|uniref:Intracellular hyphae protein 1 n=1 Tax=Colletotrichum spaethianum TaxID=700344 RepID=A0AA37P9P4_9PEZI|nr:intracellular hyphae protein 1 [Colletotrichum spaethianum]GKT48221.1 intracellular hyphae protein 1 [Colletotrichum spaethianum]